MLKLNVKVPPYEGSYELDLEGQMPSTVEWRWCRKITGYLPTTFFEAWQVGDPDAVLMLAVWAVVRSGKFPDDDVFEVAKVLESPPMDGESISLEADEEDEKEAEADPTQTEPDEERPSSGDDSSESSEDSPESEIPKATGIRDWATGSDSDRVTLVR